MQFIEDPTIRKRYSTQQKMTLQGLVAVQYIKRIYVPKGIVSGISIL